MEFYPSVPLIACVVSAVVAMRTWAREPDNRRLWPLAAVSGLASAWAFCEVLWLQASTIETATFWARCSVVPILPLAPVSLHAMAVGCDQLTPGLLRRTRRLYAACVPLMLVGLFTNGFIWEIAPTDYGWSPRPGPLVLVWGALMGRVAFECAAMFQRSATSLDEDMSRLVKVSMVIPFGIAPVTDVILPALDIHAFPRLGTAAIALVGLMQTWAAARDDDVVIPAGVSSAVLAALPDGVLSVTAAGRIRSANERFAALVGRATDELNGLPADAFLPGDVVRASRELRDFECLLTSADGARFEVAVSSTPSEFGKGTRRIMIVRDLREMTALRNRLLLSARMAAVGGLAAGIAHELNNPLAYVRSNLVCLRDTIGRIVKESAQPGGPETLEELADESASIIEESMEGIERATAIVRDVREFSHAGDDAFSPTDLNELVLQSVRLSQSQMDPTITIDVDLPELPRIPANGARLQQVLINLLINAGHAIGRSGRIHVGGVATPGGVVLTVGDTGCGIAPEDLERIFDPFFTTKPVGIGTGLGLAIAFAIVGEHGGTIDVETEPGVGTEFRITLPAVRGAPASSP